MLGLPLNVATTILSCIFSIQLSGFRTHRQRSIPIPMTALTVFFHTDAEVNVHALPESWYFIFASLWWCLCPCTHIISILCSATDVVSSGYWSILLKVPMLSVAICPMLLHLSNFYLFEFCSWFSFNPEAWNPTSAGRTPFSLTQRVMRFGRIGWMRVMVTFRWLFFTSLKTPIV